MSVVHICNNCKKEHIYKVELNSFKCNYCNHDECDVRSTDAKETKFHNILCGKDQLKEWASQLNEQADNKPLLTIELQDESSVPKVIYRGEELSYKQHIHFDWKTANKESLQSGLELLIKRVVDSKGSPFIKTIEVKSGDHFWSDVE